MLNNRFNRKVVGGDFRQYSEDMKLPVLRPGFYAVSPHLIGGYAKKLKSFADYLKWYDLKKIYGYSLTKENPHAKIILEYDEEFYESFTSSKVFVLPYQYVDTYDVLAGKVNIYHAENEVSLAENKISSVFAHLEDLEPLDISDYHQAKKLYYSEAKLAIFKPKFLDFKAQTEEELGKNGNKNDTLKLLRR